MKRILWIIHNAYLYTDKFSELDGLLAKAAEHRGFQVVRLSNRQLLPDLGSSPFAERERPDAVIFCDKDIRLAEWLEHAGLRVYNSSRAIAVSDNKAATHLVLAGGNLPQPRTIFAPFTYDNIGYRNLDFLADVIRVLGFPMVVKECYGSFGAQVYLAEDTDALRAIVLKIGTRPMLFQKFIASSAGRDIRLQVIGGRVAAGMYRWSEHGDFRANITNGGSMKPYLPSEYEKQLAVRAAELLGLDYGGVDLLFAEDGSRLVCEVNSNAHFKNIQDCTGVPVAELLIDHIAGQLEQVSGS